MSKTIIQADTVGQANDLIKQGYYLHSVVTTRYRLFYIMVKHPEEEEPIGFGT